MAQSRKQTKQTKTELDFKYLKISFPKNNYPAKQNNLVLLNILPSLIHFYLQY